MYKYCLMSTIKRDCKHLISVKLFDNNCGSFSYFSKKVVYKIQNR